MKRIILLSFMLFIGCGPAPEAPPPDAGAVVVQDAGPAFIHADAVTNDGGPMKMGCAYLQAGPGYCAPDTLPEHLVKLSPFTLEPKPITYADGGVARLTYAAARAECQHVGGDLVTEAQAEYMGPFPELTWVRDWYDAAFYSVSPEVDPVDTHNSGVHETRGGTAEGYSPSRWEREPHPDAGAFTAAVRCVF